MEENRHVESAVSARYRVDQSHVQVAVIRSVLSVVAAIERKTRRVGVRLTISSRPGEACTRFGGGYDALRQLSDLRGAGQDPVGPDRGPDQVQAVRPELPGRAAGRQGGRRAGTRGGAAAMATAGPSAAVEAHGIEVEGLDASSWTVPTETAAALKAQTEPRRPSPRGTGADGVIVRVRPGLTAASDGAASTSSSPPGISSSTGDSTWHVWRRPSTTSAARDGSPSPC